MRLLFIVQYSLNIIIMLPSVRHATHAVSVVKPSVTIRFP